eukprot:15381381-Heterocapsa_arctica.AAC.1
MAIKSRSPAYKGRVAIPPSRTTAPLVKVTGRRETWGHWEKRCRPNKRPRIPVPSWRRRTLPRS